MFVMMGMGMGQTNALLVAEGAVSAPRAHITAIANDGWRATYSTTTLTPFSRADQVALSDFVCTADSISGVKSGSNIAHPYAVSCWLIPDMERTRSL